ncbi:FHA domain protein [Dirofilaria immitis]|nr:FHA domain protein [Dirofilaria immitis]
MNNFKAPLLKRTDKKDTVVDVPLISVTQPNLEYVPPPFAVEPSKNISYGFEVIKNGTVIDRIDFGKRKARTFLVIGRLPSCDIQLEHPTISRHHCILQYGNDLMNRAAKGWHIYDLGSTHGTKLNKKDSTEAVHTNTCRICYAVWGSSRLMTLLGPNSDTEEEWEYSPTEMRRLIEQKKLYDEIQKRKRRHQKPKKKVMAREGSHVEDQEERYRDDPLKVLSHFFEKEGFDMEFTYEEISAEQNHKWICSVDNWSILVCISDMQWKQKEAQFLCAFNACRTLDMHGLLFRSHETKRRAKNLVDNDFYDSDEDTYFDRTGQIETNREKRRQRALEVKGKVTAEIETFETLMKKIALTNKELTDVEAHLAVISNRRKEGDDKKMIMMMTILINSANNWERLEKLAKIAEPIELPTLKTSSNQVNEHIAGSLSAATTKKLMRMRQAKNHFQKKKEVHFVMENEDDEKLVAGSGNTSSNVHQRDFSAVTDGSDRKQFNIPTISTVITDSGELSVAEEIEKNETAIVSLAVTHKEPQHNVDYGYGIANRDEDYIMWMPPENQKGDGTNALNAKFGEKKGGGDEKKFGLQRSKDMRSRLLMFQSSKCMERCQGVVSSAIASTLQSIETYPFFGRLVTRIEHKDFECTLHHRVDSRWYVWLRSIEGARPVRVKKVTICYTLESGCLRLQPKEGGKPHLRLNMTTRPIANKAEVERICWDPKDGELYLSRMKPEETLVEVRSDSDVQIDRLTLV